MQLVAINKTNGNFTNFGDEMKGVWATTDTLTYDQNSNTFYLIGTNKIGNNYLYSFHSNNGSIKGNPIYLEIDLKFSISLLNVKSGALKTIAQFGQLRNSDDGAVGLNTKENYVFVEAQNDASFPNQTVCYLVDLKTGSVEQKTVDRNLRLYGNMVYEPKFNSFIGFSTIQNKEANDQQVIVSYNPLVDEKIIIASLNNVEAKNQTFVVGSSVNLTTDHLFFITQNSFTGTLSLFEVDYYDNARNKVNNIYTVNLPSSFYYEMASIVAVSLNNN
ncbi:hypothetical protein ABK040_000726 [Willaertia magna]